MLKRILGFLPIVALTAALLAVGGRGVSADETSARPACASNKAGHRVDLRRRPAGASLPLPEARS